MYACTNSAGVGLLARPCYTAVEEVQGLVGCGEYRRRAHVFCISFHHHAKGMPGMHAHIEEDADGVPTADGVAVALQVRRECLWVPLQQYLQHVSCVLAAACMRSMSWPPQLPMKQP